jgi:hypothetical protein
LLPLAACIRPSSRCCCVVRERGSMTVPDKF